MAETTTTAASAGDAELRRLDELAHRFDDGARDIRLLARRVRRLREGRAGGRSWHSLAGGALPGVLHLVDRVVRRISGDGGSLRRVLVGGLRREGATVPGIARLLGVSHQRISVLLRPGRGDAASGGPQG